MILFFIVLFDEKSLFIIIYIDAGMRDTYNSRVLKVTKLGLMESTESGEKLIKWKKILKLEKSRHHVYLYLGEAAALIIPKEMITDDNAFKVFYNDLIAALKKENAEKA